MMNDEDASTYIRTVSISLAFECARKQTKEQTYRVYCRHKRTKVEVPNTGSILRAKKRYSIMMYDV